uniref:POP1 domain-containing protein n=1 Tax=Macrostomum lignano TaxID=282301 RepID=A0A1I8F329_9PLAT
MPFILMRNTTESYLFFSNRDALHLLQEFNRLANYAAVKALEILPLRYRVQLQPALPTSSSGLWLWRTLNQLNPPPRRSNNSSRRHPAAQPAKKSSTSNAEQLARLASLKKSVSDAMEEAVAKGNRKPRLKLANMGSNADLSREEPPVVDRSRRIQRFWHYRSRWKNLNSAKRQTWTLRDQLTREHQAELRAALLKEHEEFEPALQYGGESAVEGRAEALESAQRAQQLWLALTVFETP